MNAQLATAAAPSQNSFRDAHRDPLGGALSQTMLSVDDVTMRFGTTTVLDGVSLDVDRGEVVCLLGPSGSGKSTLLRLIAGVEKPTAGRIRIGEVEVAGPRVFVEPEQRRVGMVFQDYALFPHLTIEANVAFGLRRKDSQLVAGLLERLGLQKFARSYPHQLSGGERQRVALARAMAPAPHILLMDEPFSSLDSRLRDDVRRRTLQFLRESQTTTVIVTHDPDEALRIGNRIALIDSGRLVQYSRPKELYTRPDSLFAARFFSDVTPAHGVCNNGRVETPLGSFSAPDLVAGTRAVACVRPHHLRITEQSTGISSRVISSEFRGECQHLLVKVDGLETPVALHAPQSGAYVPEALGPGATVHLEINSDAVPVIASR